jgi:hypothetical protein
LNVDTAVAAAAAVAFGFGHRVAAPRKEKWLQNEYGG